MVADASDVQLANFAALRIFGPRMTGAERAVALWLIRSSPVARDIWLEQHEAFQDELRKLGKPASA